VGVTLPQVFSIFLFSCLVNGLFLVLLKYICISRIGILQPVHYVVSYCNIGATKDLFNTSFSSLGYACLLDTCTTSHMKFQRYFFE
jgi:hypothetical protein